MLLLPISDAYCDAESPESAGTPIEDTGRLRLTRRLALARKIAPMKPAWPNDVHLPAMANSPGIINIRRNM